jgi:hypothetical protein
MNVIKLAKQADPGFEFRASGALADCLVGLDAIERFAALVRAAALDEAAGVCDEAHELMNSSFQGAAAAIRQLKEAT